MTAALEGGEWSAARPGRTLPPGKTWYPFYRRLGGPQGWSGREENLVLTRIRSRTIQPVGSRYTDWATQPTFLPTGVDLQNVLLKSGCPAKIPIKIWHAAHKANLYLFIIFWQMSRRLTWRKGRILSATPYQLPRLCANERDRTGWTWMKNDEKCVTKWFGPNLNAHCHERFDRWLKDTN